MEELDGLDFILSVGTFESRKNYLLLYQVWSSPANAACASRVSSSAGQAGLAAGDTRFAITDGP